MKPGKFLTITMFAVLLPVTRLWACTVCKSNQPKGFENITHGSGPSGVADLVITWTAVVIVAITLYLSVKYLVKPKENKPDHIKNFVINEFN